MNSNTSRPVPPANTGSALLNWFADTSLRAAAARAPLRSLRSGPAFDAVLRDPLDRLTTALINLQRPRDDLSYLLVGYCGIPMVLVSWWCLARPGEAASGLGFPPGGPFEQFFAVAYLGMSITSLLAPFLRRSYVIGPAVCWAVFFAGATAIHFMDESAHQTLTHGSALAIFATHGLISLLLLIALFMSRAGGA